MPAGDTRGGTLPALVGWCRPGGASECSGLPAQPANWPLTLRWHAGEALLALKAIIPPGGYGTSQIKAGWPTSASSPNFNPCNATAVWPHVKCTQFRVVEM